jgi:hypothetical protein
VEALIFRGATGMQMHSGNQRSLRRWILPLVAIASLWPAAFAQNGPARVGGRGGAAEPTRTQGGGGDLEGYDPNDKRPAPRLADGKPDFSGVWTNLQGNLGQDKLPPFAPGGAAIYNSPHNPDYDDPNGFYCMPDGMPRHVSDPYPLQLVHKPGLLVFLYEYDHFFRIVPTTGQPHDPDTEPSWMGTSSAKWDSDTLVVDTVALTTHEDHWLDGAGHRHSDALHLIERMTRKNFSTILYDLTIDDPKVFTAPWTQHKRYALRPDWKIIEYICEENNRTALRGLDSPRPHYNGSKPGK